MKIHRLIQHIEERVEKDLRVWRYLLPPREEKEGHEILGSTPLWQPVTTMKHFICDTGNLKPVMILVSNPSQDVTNAS